MKKLNPHYSAIKIIRCKMSHQSHCLTINSHHTHWRISNDHYQLRYYNFQRHKINKSHPCFLINKRHQTYFQINNPVKRKQRSRCRRFRCLEIMQIQLVLQFYLILSLNSIREVFLDQSCKLLPNKNLKLPTITKHQ